MKRIFFIAAAASLMITQTGCFGSFELIKKVYDFNDGISDNKFVKTLVFWVMNIVPVYGIAGFIDAVILNLIEFWSGSNPLAMEAGQVEEQFMAVKGENYKVTTTKNQMVFEKVTPNGLENMGAMVFSEATSSWSFVKDGEATVVAKVNLNENTVDYRTASSFETISWDNVDCITLNSEKNANYELALK